MKKEQTAAAKQVNPIPETRVNSEWVIDPEGQQIEVVVTSLSSFGGTPHIGVIKLFGQVEPFSGWLPLPVWTAMQLSGFLIAKEVG